MRISRTWGRVAGGAAVAAACVILFPGEQLAAKAGRGRQNRGGPLKLTDIVGLDIRLHIGDYLARELNNPAFEPPALLRKMVAKGLLGKKSGEGFYKW